MVIIRLAIVHWDWHKKVSCHLYELDDFALLVCADLPKQFYAKTENVLPQTSQAK